MPITEGRDEYTANTQLRHPLSNPRPDGPKPAVHALRRHLNRVRTHYAGLSSPTRFLGPPTRRNQQRPVQERPTGTLSGRRPEAGNSGGPGDTGGRVLGKLFERTQTSSE